VLLGTDNYLFERKTTLAVLSDIIRTAHLYEILL